MGIPDVLVSGLLLIASSLLIFLFGHPRLIARTETETNKITSLSFSDLGLLLSIVWFYFLSFPLASKNISSWMLLMFLIVSCLLIIFRKHRKITTARKIRSDLPILLDTLVLGIGAGQTLMSSFLIAQRTLPESSPLKSEINKLMTDQEIGLSQVESLKKLKSRLGDPQSDIFLDALIQANKLGTPIGKILREQSDRLRVFLLLEGEQYANTLSIKLLIPLLIFIFPASFLVILSPIIIFVLEQTF